MTHTLLTFSKANSSRTKHSTSPGQATLMLRSILGMAVNGWPSIQTLQHCKCCKHLSCSTDMTSFFFFLGWVNQRHSQPLRSWRRNTGMRSFLSIRPPTCLRAHLVVRKHFYFFVWLLTLLDSGGVEDFQQDYAFTAWASSASPFKRSYHLAHSGWITLQLRLMGTSMVYSSTLWANNSCNIYIRFSRHH